MQRTGHMRTPEKTASFKPRREEGPQETIPAGTWVLDFQPPKLRDNYSSFLLLKP